MMKQQQDGRMGGKQHMRAQHAMQQAMTKACEGKKAGESVNFTLGQRDFAGSCEMVFMPERGQKLKSNYKMSAASMAPRQHGTVMTDAERAEMVKQFDLRLAQRQAQQKAIQTACQGQTSTQAVQIKFGEHNVNGQCKLKFKPQAKAA
jgi:hypothetical protein